MASRLDAIDLRLIDLLQQNGEVPVAELARRTGLSLSPCWRRVRRLKETGILTKTVALVDASKLGIVLTGFVMIRMEGHTAERFSELHATVSCMPEVVDFYRTNGEVDYLLRVLLPDLRAYDRLYMRLIECRGILDISSTFVMEPIKTTTAVPLTLVSSTR